MIRIVQLVSLAIVITSLCDAADGPVDRAPNIVMIFTDDQRHDAIGYAGNAAIQTPHLDRLASSALVFKNCFVNTSICAINRANILAGQYPTRHSIQDFHRAFTPEQLRQTVPGRLQAAGYQTAFFGKWGIGDTPEKTHQGAAVFDYWAGQPKQSNYFHETDCRYAEFDGFSRPLDDLCDCPADSRGKSGYDVRIGKDNLIEPIHVDSEITPAHVERFLSGRDTTKPFCLMLFFKSPHGPFGDWDPTLENAIRPSKIKFPPAATRANAEREPQIVKDSLGWSAGQTLLNNPNRHDKSTRDYYRSPRSDTVEHGTRRAVAFRLPLRSSLRSQWSHPSHAGSANENR